MKDKKPNIESAAVVARVISRLLRKNGFLMSESVDRHNWTEGVYVHRVGYSKELSIDYRLQLSDMTNDEACVRRKECLKKVRQFVSDHGYVLDDRKWIVCERD